MDIYIFADESGVFDRAHNKYFVFGGLMFFSFDEMDEANRRYVHAEAVVRRGEELAASKEAKACFLSNGGKSKLFRSLNKFHKFGVVVRQDNVLPEIFNNKKSKQRFLDFAFKITVKRKFEALIQRAVKPLHSWGGYKAPMGIWLKSTHS